MLYVIFTGQSVSFAKYTFESTSHRGVTIKKVAKDARSKFSGDLILTARHELYIFGGDLSWIIDDLRYFAQFFNSGRRHIKILTDDADDRVLQTIASWGVEVRRYSNGDQAPFKGLIIDPSKVAGGECRAVTIRKSRRSMGASADLTYEFVEYQSDVHSAAILAMIKCFETLFNTGVSVVEGKSKH